MDFFVVGEVVSYWHQNFHSSFVFLSPVPVPVHISLFLQFSCLAFRRVELVISCMCVSVYVCMCVCVCVCVYSSNVEASSNYKMSETNLRGTDQRSCVVNISQGSGCFCQVPSSQCFCQVPSFMSYFTSKDENSSQHKLERNRCDILTASKKMICIDIGYKSVSTQNGQVTKRY